MRINERLKRLETRRQSKTVYAFRWGDDDMVTVDGGRMPLDEFSRRYPDATVIHFTWGNNAPTEIGQ